MSDPGKAVFLSYASQDSEAAQRLCDALRAAGVEVWFDRNELVGGDAWDAKIRKQIADCALFLPVISANTEARLEGYFRIEWKLAARRTHAMASSKAFLLPIVIDDTRDGTAQVPDEFHEVQWTRLAGGQVSPAFTARVQRLLGLSVPAGSAARVNSPRASAPAPTAEEQRSRRPLAGIVVLGAVVALGVGGFVWWQRGSATPAPAIPAAPQEKVASAEPASEAQKLVEQAQRLLEQSDELNRDNLYLAEELVKRALSLEPANPDAVLLSANISYSFVWYLFDNSAARRELLQTQASRALALQPKATAARLAQVNAQTALFFNYTDTPVAFDLEKEARALVALEPRNWRAHRALGSVLRTLNRREEAVAALRSAYDLSNGNPDYAADLINVLVRSGRYAEAEALRAEAMRGTTCARLLCWDVMLKLRWSGDPAAANEALKAWPGWLAQEDRGLYHRWLAQYWGRRPGEADRIARMAVRDMVRDFSFYGPTAVLRALANEMAGNREAALADWRLTLERAEKELQAEADNEPGLYWKAWALARLGRLDEAKAIVAVLVQRGSTSAFTKVTYIEALQLAVGDKAGAFASIRRRLAAQEDSLGVTRAVLELDPAYDSVRNDPEFQALVRAAHAPTPRAAAVVDDKSVAVLAFANLSDDKANEYFSDGVSEELLNVLAKVPSLKVSARTSAFYFKGKDVPLAEIARQLGVAYVVEGSVRKAGEKVRITAQLIKAADGFHVWSETFTRDLKDVFAVQDEIARLIAENLQVKLGQSATAAAAADGTYDLLLRARHSARQQSNDGARRAIDVYRDVLRESPNSAAAWAGIAESFVQLGRFNGMPALEAMNEARTAARKALELAPENATALVALGWVARTADWNWREARRLFGRALELQPGDAATLSANAILELNLGRNDVALNFARRAVAADPLNASAHFELGVVLYMVGRPAEALPVYQRAIALAPSAEEYYCHLAVILALLGRHDEARAAVEREPNPGYRLIAAAHCAALRGDKAEAARARAELESKYAEDFPGYISDVCASQGDLESALKWFERSIARRDNSTPWFKSDVWHAPLRSDPRWQELIRRVGLADDQLK
jgi:TolB-like protein/predicted Zn-dependent protease